MGMPKKLFMFDTYINGQTYLGLIEEITPPKLSLKTDKQNWSRHNFESCRCSADSDKTLEESK